MCDVVELGTINTSEHAVNKLAFERVEGGWQCVADGVVKLWDVRTMTDLAAINTSEHPANKLAFDRSGEVRRPRGAGKTSWCLTDQGSA